METSAQRIKSIREEAGMNRREFSEYFGIPLRTLEDWEYDRRMPPEYVVRLLAYQVKYEGLRSSLQKNRNQTSHHAGNVLITEDEDGEKFVVFPQIIFPGKRSVAWNEVEKYLVRYVGCMFDIAEDKDVVYIGKDFPDEYAGSVYTRNLNGPVARAKANAVQGIPELMEIATKKRWSEDYQKRHGKKAANGWYRYDTRFGIPVLGESGEIMRYNIYRAVIIVRFASDNKLYLYDIQNIKKETSNPS